MEKIKTSSLVENLGLLVVQMMIGVAFCIFTSLMHLQHTSIPTSHLSVPVLLTVKPPRLTCSSNINTILRPSVTYLQIGKEEKKERDRGRDRERNRTRVRVSGRQV